MTAIEQIRKELERRYENGDGTVDITAALLDVAEAAQALRDAAVKVIATDRPGWKASEMRAAVLRFDAVAGKIPQICSEDEL